MKMPSRGLEPENRSVKTEQRAAGWLKGSWSTVMTSQLRLNPSGGLKKKRLCNLAARCCSAAGGEEEEEGDDGHISAAHKHTACFHDNGRE